MILKASSLRSPILDNAHTSYTISNHSVSNCVLAHATAKLKSHHITFLNKKIHISYLELSKPRILRHLRILLTIKKFLLPGENEGNIIVKEIWYSGEKTKTHLL